MAEIGDLVPIDDNNTARWPEGMAPSAVNNAGRADEGIMSRWHRDTNGSLVSTGTSTAYQLTTNQSLTAYYDGLEVTFKAHVACGVNPSLQLGALTTAKIVTADGNALAAGDIPINSVVNVISQDNASTPTWRLMNTPRKAIATATKMLFVQSSAPEGWTQDTSVNDKVLRVVSSTGGGEGGSWTISGVTVDGHALTIDEIPAHTHSLTRGGSTIVTAPGAQGTASAASGNTGSTGGGLTHTHGLTADGTWRPAYVDGIIATKD